MKMRRRRGRRSAWNWATRLDLAYTPTTPDRWGIKGPLLPAPRVDWLLEQGRGRDAVTVTGILLWLDFIIYNENAEGPPLVQPIDFYILKERYDAGYAGQYHPYDEPTVPAGVTSWDTAGDEETDGLDPYLWTHHMSPYVAGTNIYDSSFTGNATNVLAIQPDNCIQPTFNVSAQWQPSVHIRTKRRMMKGEQLTLGFGASTAAADYNYGITYDLAAYVRVLTS